MEMLSIHPPRQKDLQTPQQIDTAPVIPIYNFEDSFRKICTRLTVPAGGVTLSADFVIEDSGLEDVRTPDVPPTPVEQLPDDILVYLRGSRYCETDRLIGVAWAEFGALAAVRDRVEAIVAFVHKHIVFGYKHARSDKTARNAYQEKQGLCRDFAHLAITLCRCMNISARYCTGYLDDIGMPPVDPPSKP